MDAVSWKNVAARSPIWDEPMEMETGGEKSIIWVGEGS